MNARRAFERDAVVIALGSAAFVAERRKNHLNVHSTFRCRKCRKCRILSIKVVDIRIVIEGQSLSIAISAEEVDNPLLLFRIQQPLSVMITIVVAVSVQILLHGDAQPLLMLALDLCKDRAETPCHTFRLASREEAAAVFTY